MPVVVYGRTANGMTPFNLNANDIMGGAHFIMVYIDRMDDNTADPRFMATDDSGLFGAALYAAAKDGWEIVFQTHWLNMLNETEGDLTNEPPKEK